MDVGRHPDSLDLPNRRRVTAKKRDTSMQLVGERGQVVDERALIDDLTFELLWGDGIGRAEGFTSKGLSNGKPCHLDATGTTQHDRCTEIAMNYPGFLGHEQRFSDFGKNPRNLTRRHSVRWKLVGERRPIDAFVELVHAPVRQPARSEHTHELRGIEALELP